MSKNNTIERLANMKHLSGAVEIGYVVVKTNEVIDKLNEVIDKLNGPPPNILICPHCSSDEWESGCMSTLLAGSTNYYTYTCSNCGKSTTVKKVRARDPHVYLGPNDEIRKGESNG